MSCQPGTQLHKVWSELPAPDIACGYWRLSDDARWVDVLECMLADEALHRDVNHTFASLPPNAEVSQYLCPHAPLIVYFKNPFIQQHQEQHKMEQ